jgi:hypothetical protein
MGERMDRFSNFRFSEECSDDIRLCIVADDSKFGAPVVVIEIPLDVPSDREDFGMAIINKIVAMLNG